MYSDNKIILHEVRTIRAFLILSAMKFFFDPINSNLKAVLNI